MHARKEAKTAAAAAAAARMHREAAARTKRAFEKQRAVLKETCWICWKSAEEAITCASKKVTITTYFERN